MGGTTVFSEPVRPEAEAKMKRVLGAATVVLIGLVTAPLAVAAEMQSFWVTPFEFRRRGLACA
jgi:hypothetical protein